MDVGENTTLGDGDTSQELAQLLIVADSQLDVAGHDTGLLVVASGIAREFENLSCQVFEDSSEVDGGTSADTLCKYMMEMGEECEEMRQITVMVSIVSFRSNMQLQ